MFSENTADNPGVRVPTIDADYLRGHLLEMLAIPGPTGFTDEIVRYVCDELLRLGIDYKLARRGTIFATIRGRESAHSRVIVAHLDTIGATVRDLKENGRLAISPVGTWSSRFAEGGRVTVFSKSGAHRGQVLPLLASGHAFNLEVDTLPISWKQVEVRLNRRVSDRSGLETIGIETGDFVAFDSDPETDDDGYVSARHLDNKGGSSALLAALEAIVREDLRPAVDLTVAFTVTEEVGTGGSAMLETRVAEFVGIDIAPVAKGQLSEETAVTLCAQDTSGPFDRKLLLALRRLANEHDINVRTDVFRYYYSDANSALIAGNDVRHGLITFGTDATHGYERTHLSSLTGLSKLLTIYAQSPLV